MPNERPPSRRGLRALSVLFAAAPFAFALVRFVNTRSDLRMMWMALASLAGATAVMVIGGARRRPRPALIALSAAALAAAVLLAGWTAMRLGATAAAGIWPVSFVLAFCWTASYALDALARPRAADA